MSYTLTHLCCVADFSKYTSCLYIEELAIYILLSKGFKSALYVWGKRLLSGYNIQYRTVFFTAEWYFLIPTTRSTVIILDLDPENSFVKKRTSLSLTETTLLPFNKKKYQRPGRVALGAVFIKKTRSNPNFPLRPNGNSNLI